MRLLPSKSTAREWFLIKKLNRPETGFSLIEAVLASTLLLLMATFLISGYLFSQENLVLSGNRDQAALIATEGLEAVRNIQDANFSNLTNGTYGLATTSQQWNFSGASDTVGIYKRQLTISTIDSNRKKVSATVTWNQNTQRAGSLTLETYFTNWTTVTMPSWASSTIAASINFTGNHAGVEVVSSGNQAFVIVQDTSNNFFTLDLSSTTPTISGQTSVYNNNGNMITDIAATGSYAFVTTNEQSHELESLLVSNPAAPQLIDEYNLTQNNLCTDISIYGNIAYIGTVGKKLFAVNISNPYNPVYLGNILTLTGIPYDLIAQGNYVYLTTDDNTYEFQVINVTNQASKARVGYINLNNGNQNANANALALYGTTTYVARSDGRIYPINITTPTAPTLITSTGFLTSTTTTATVSDMVAFSDGTATYLAMMTSDANGELKIFNVTNPASPTLLKSFNIGGSSYFGPGGLAYNADLGYLLITGPALASNNYNQLMIIAPQ